ncbi:STAS domain-containing protein [Mangrovibrevibacter kandeliae]|uniref:STAS domain-containing protein n=1 Tax=Mangrovibrevibacter kandeliae TaxID=2968473 RepID=UPI00211812B4|nr:STAS domain-containing protein [Aurantimonas sp. CSK15Z-1]MCQ8783917.1 STAS domain-containing protein [Aurantimonas sp. CSK15Z-1]
MTDVQDATESGALMLPAILDITAAGPLTEQLLALRGQRLTLDASSVEQIGGQCLQILLSAVATWKADMTSIEIISPSEGFERGLQLLGLAAGDLMDKEIVQ